MYKIQLTFFYFFYKIISENCKKTKLDSDIKKAMEPLYTSAPEEERAGIGFAVMQSFMDRLTVKSEEGKGTVIIMEKKIILTIILI